jgi:hypothetical protein
MIFHILNVEKCATVCLNSQVFQTVGSLYNICMNASLKHVVVDNKIPVRIYVIRGCVF